MESIHMAAHLGHSNFPSLLFLTLSFMESFGKCVQLRTAHTFVVRLLSRISYNVAHIKSHVSSVVEFLAGKDSFYGRNWHDNAFLITRAL